MTLVDTGPIVALFDPSDSEHFRCRHVLESIRDPLVTTLPVLTESFHLLRPGSLGCRRLGEFLDRGGVRVWPLDDAAVKRCLELMEQYRDRPMDLADASLVAAAEQ
ncbi:MAG: PIN domain-containing protein, partial [Thermoanaerobaculia bacterium]|nr:PIN domain-containing protein [Thermoanaerobaculia bacterium]